MNASCTACRHQAQNRDERSLRGLKITTCYFGLGASVVATALEIPGLDPVMVYPGSLVEYAVREGLVQSR